MSVIAFHPMDVKISASVADWKIRVLGMMTHFMHVTVCVCMPYVYHAVVSIM